MLRACQLAALLLDQLVPADACPFPFSSDEGDALNCRTLVALLPRLFRALNAWCHDWHSKLVNIDYGSFGTF